MHGITTHRDNPDNTRYGATVDANNDRLTFYFDTETDRAAWLDWMDLGVHDLIDPDSTRHPAELDPHGNWIPKTDS